MSPDPVQPRRGMPTWLLPTLVAMLVAGGTFALWRSVSGSGTHEMHEGSVVVDTRNEDVAESDDTAGLASTASALITASITTLSPAPLPTATTSVGIGPTTVGPTTAPLILPTTVPPASPPTVVPTPSPPITTIVPSGGVEFSSRCQSAVGFPNPWSIGWEVGVPAGWFTSEPVGGWECSIFDRAPVATDTNPFDVVYPIVLKPGGFGDVLDRYDDALSLLTDGYWSVRARTEVLVGGLAATRLELVYPDDAVLSGAQVVCYTVDQDGYTVVQFWGTAFTDDEYGELTKIVDAMAADITFIDA